MSWWGGLFKSPSDTNSVCPGQSVLASGVSEVGFSGGAAKRGCELWFCRIDGYRG